MLIDFPLADLLCQGPRPTLCVIVDWSGAWARPLLTTPGTPRTSSRKPSSRSRLSLPIKIWVACMIFSSAGRSEWEHRCCSQPQRRQRQLLTVQNDIQVLDPWGDPGPEAA